MNGDVGTGGGAILLAAGRSTRMGGLDKMLAPLAGLPVAAHALRAFAACPGISAIVLVCGEGNRTSLEGLAVEHGGGKVTAVVSGGARRRDSVAAGFSALPPIDLVVVHDVARPLVTPSMVARGLELAANHGAAVIAAPLTDTIKEVSEAVNGAAPIERTIDRSRLRAAQTPQTFRRELLLRAHAAHDRDATDDAVLVEALGQPVLAYDADGPNLKITTPADLLLAAALLETAEAGTLS